MGKWKRYIPEGMQDILFDECDIKLYVEKSLRNIYKCGGFCEIISPTLEFYDVFESDNQPIPQEKMYKLFDTSGRILVLRPDMTTPIARITSTKIKKNIYPLKLCYTSNIFRINEDLGGKMSEITQSGVEIIGTKNIKADTEVIITAIKALLSLGIKNFKIELGQADFFKALIQDIKLNNEEMEKLKRLIENKNYITLGDFLKGKEKNINKDNSKVLKQLPQLFGGIETIDKAREITKDKEALRALGNIYDVYKIIDKIGLSSYIAIDLGMVQNIDYYTGIIFKTYVDEVGEYIVSGGRYDNLIEKFGESLPATGFAINIDNVIMALKRQSTFKLDKPKKILIFYKDKYLVEAYELMNKIQKDGVICELSLFGEEEESLDYARQNKVNELISIISRDETKVYNLKTEEVISSTLEELKRRVK